MLMMTYFFLNCFHFFCLDFLINLYLYRTTINVVMRHKAKTKITLMVPNGLFSCYEMGGWQTWATIVLSNPVVA